MTHLNLTFFVRVYGSNQNIAKYAAVANPSPALSQLPIDFETLGRALESWPNLHFEWDGSFVWVSPLRNSDGSPAWQMDGMLYDHASAVQYVELKGYCPLDQWRQLMNAFGLAVNDASPECPPGIIHDVYSNRWHDLRDFENNWPQSSED